MNPKLVQDLLIKRYKHSNVFPRFQPQKNNQMSAENWVPQNLFFISEKISRIKNFSRKKCEVQKIESQP